MKPLRTARLQAATPRGLELACEHGVTCRISLLGADLARVRFTRADGPRERRSWMVPAHGAPDVPWQGRPRDDESAWPLVAHTCEEVAGAVILRGPSLALRVDLAPFALSWMLPDGTIFARDRAAHAVMLGRTALRHASARHPADRYHGLGDKTGPLDLHGRRLRTTMIDSLGYDPERGDPLYKHWPFLIVRDGASGIHHGILYDSLAEATFDLGCEHDNYYGLYRSYDAADGDLDYYVFPGPGLLDVTAKFLDLTGHAPSPPRWSLGYAQTAMSLADAPDAQARIENFLGECAAQDMPISAFHFGSGYTSIGPRRYVFTWNRAKFPDPEALMRRFHAQGVRLVANLKPCLLDDHPAFAEVAASGAFVTAQGAPALSQFWDGEGAHLDFTNPAAIAWWQDGLRASVLGTGIDAAWNDNNEYGFREEEALCHGFGEALPLDRARSLHALLMTRASLEAQRAARPDERAFTVTRAGCPGIQRYAQSWSGDNTTSWASLKWNLRTGLQMSLSGLFNIGHDVGGFAGPEPEAELLVRWTQAGLLHPRFIMNSWKTSGVTTVPWLHAEVAPMVRAAICLRYRLIPYLYSLMQDRHAPPLRPVFAQFPGDPACLADSDDLMLGPFLLAAPVVEAGARARQVRLPAGPECWFDFWTEERLPAGAIATLAAPLDRLPLLLPAGAILPMTDAPEDFSRLHDELSRCLRLFPGPGAGHSGFTLVEDDGITAGGAVARLRFELSWTAEEVRLTGRCDEGAAPAGVIGVALPLADRRRLVLDGALALAPRRFRPTPPG